jgi:RNA polymerase sigma-70 factor (ECF subfamily)
VRLNRAAAIALTGRTAEALELVDALEGLDRYRHFHATRADLLRRLDRRAEAAAAYRTALSLTDAGAERRFLERRLRELDGEPQE